MWGPLKMQAYVIGSPIFHSLSPAIHNAAFAALGIDARYEAVEVVPSELGKWVDSVRHNDLFGFNVTLPHKEAIIRLLDKIVRYRLGDNSELMGAWDSARNVAGPSPVKNAPVAGGSQTPKAA